MLDFSKILSKSAAQRFNNIPQPDGVENMPTPTQDNSVQTQTPANTFGQPEQANTNELTKPTIQPVTSYFNKINDGLTKLSGYKGTFSPEQRRKIATLYSNARNKYNTSSKNEEETNAFNQIKTNPIWKTFNK